MPWGRISCEGAYWAVGHAVCAEVTALRGGDVLLLLLLVVSLIRGISKLLLGLAG